MKKTFLLVITILGLITLNAQQIPFQGKLQENGTPVNGSRNFDLSINQGSINWSETHSNVAVIDGLYNLILGSVTPLPKDLFNYSQSVTLGISVNGQFLQDVVIYLPFGVRWKANGANEVYFDEGYVGIGVDNPSRTLHIGSTDSEMLRIQDIGEEGSAAIAYLTLYDSQTRMGYLGFPTSANSDMYLTNNIGGLRFEAGTSVASMYLGTNGFLGIGDNTPSNKLDINGGIRISNTTIANRGVIRYNNGIFEGYDGSSWNSFTSSSTQQEDFTVGTVQPVVINAVAQEAFTGSTTRSSIWQSFSPEETVKLKDIDLNFANSTNVNIRFRIYPGEGIGQQAIFSRDFDASDFGPSLTFQSFEVGDFANITLEAGETYTFFVQGLGDDLTFRTNTSNPYPFGVISYSSGTDAVFRIVGEIEDGFNLEVTTSKTTIGADLDVQGRIKDEKGFIMPVGTVLPYAGGAVPEGWLLCDGTTVRRDLYDDLFTAIGTNWGEGDGSTTFHLPDLRGQFLRGVDNGANEDPDVANRSALNVGGNTGNNVGSYQGEEFKKHRHKTLEWNDGRVFSSNIGLGEPEFGLTMTGFIPTTDKVNLTGEIGGSETRPKNAYVNYIIKY